MLAPKIGTDSYYSFLPSSLSDCLARSIAQTAVAPAAGDGTSDNPYQITELGNLVWLQERADAGETAGKHYLLMNDIDASDTANWNDEGTELSIKEGFLPIKFNGTFDGNKKGVTGLTINRPEMADVGLFGYLGESGKIENLDLDKGSIIGLYHVGILVGRNSQGKIGDCHTTGTITGNSCVGGLVGANSEGVITDCAATGDVTGYENIGGLSGYNSTDGLIMDCTASGKAKGSEQVGGIVGINYGVLTRCYASGEGSGAKSVGGLAGDNDCIVKIMYYDEGYSYMFFCAIIEQCGAMGAVTGVDYVGGLIGYNCCGETYESFSTGSVKGTYAVGGLIGRSESDEQSYVVIDGCYSSSAVVGGGTSWADWIFFDFYIDWSRQIHWGR
jgi:hypothetical protein